VKVTAHCATCGPLYTSSDIKAGAHRTNAQAKAEGIAKAHSDSFPDHVVEVDPGFAKPQHIADPFARVR
jgi:hypothetical protein